MSWRSGDPHGRRAHAHGRGPLWCAGPGSVTAARCAPIWRHESPQPQMMLFEELIAQSPGEASEAEVDEADINILMYTSGTTGRPKGSC